MIPQTSIEQILDIPIVEVLSRYIKLKKKGAAYEACCPFHNEKTPSFKVSSAKNIFKCFGCGQGGNSIQFVMEHKKVTFPVAAKILAKEFNITIEEKTLTKEEVEISKQRDSLRIVNQIALKYFRSQLTNEKNPLPYEYALNRWSDKTIQEFDIGFAPDSWDSFLKFARGQGIKTEILINSGLCKESSVKGKFIDVFRNRLIFPVKDKFGRVIAFSGRNLSGKKGAPKYLNTKETEVYSKSRSLFGIDIAWAAVSEKGCAYLVEGHPDVIRLHEIGIYNVLASAGTALTREQISIIKSICNSINIIGDSDKAGLAAVEKSARMIISEGLSCNVVKLPEGKEKEDPDSFFKSEKQFKNYVNEHINDYIVELANRWRIKANNPDFKLKAINEISRLIVNYDDPTSHELYIAQVSQIIKPKKAWTDKIKELQKGKEVKTSESRVPDHVSFQDWEKYGFYSDKNCYYFRIRGSIIRGSNFIMKPLFHIQSVVNAKRLYEITNEFNYKEVIELAQRDLVSLGRFKERVESLGNFLWEASETELNKLKRYLYENTESCTEIMQLGWHKDGFWAWGNGLFNGSFIKVDDNGISRIGDKNYYLPAFSNIYQMEDGLFMSERKFIHREKSDITLKDYSKLIIDVFGQNAIIALCFYITTLFRDSIINRFNFFPILNLFGPKGAGKTELAVSLLQFFGKQSKGPNINNTSKPALADHVAQVANACVHIDEYKNNIDFEKIEFLKGMWDGTGRTRMNMDKDKKKETTAVDSGVIVSGQEMPTADIALFSRLIYLSFNKYEYNDKEKARFNELKEVEKKGLTHITHDLLKLRKYFIDNYLNSYEVVSNDMVKNLKGEIIEDRIFRNWLIVLSAYYTIKDKIGISFNYSGLIKQAVQQIRIQNKETKKSNEISSFWNIVQYLYAEGLIQEDVDYKIKLIDELKTDIINSKWTEAKNVIFIQHSRIFMLYRKQGKLAGEKILPVDSIEYYLRNDKRFLGKKSAVSFKAVDPRTGMADGITEGKVKRKITTAYTFLYDELDITLTNVEQDVDILGNEMNIEKKTKETEVLPF